MVGGQEIAFHFDHKLSLWWAGKSHDAFHNADVALAWFQPITPITSGPEFVSFDQIVHPLVFWGPLHCREHPRSGACMEA